MKGLLHKIDVPIYCQRIYVSFCKETLVDRFGIEDMRKDSCDGFTTSVIERENGKQAFILYLEKRGDCLHVSTVAHESYHVADMIFEHCGVEYKYDSGNEHMAYLLDWIVNKIFDCLDIDNQFSETVLGEKYEH